MRRWLAIGVALLLATGCSSSEEGSPQFASPLSFDDLRDAGSTCPVDIDATLDDSGVDADTTGSTDVSVEDASKSDTDSDLAKAKGVYVSCTQPLSSGGSLEVHLIAGQAGAPLLLPLLQHLLDASVDQLEDVAQTIGGTDPGELVDLPGDAPVAFAPIAVDGADAAALLISAEDSLDRADVDALGNAILDRL